jgi:excisionase family DNA binding protein
MNKKKPGRGKYDRTGKRPKPDRGALIDGGKMTTEEAAAFLRLPVATIHKLTHERQIPFYKIGRYCIFDKNSLESWAESKKRPALKQK